MSKEVANINDSAWAVVQAATTAVEKYDAGRFALTTARVTKSGKDIPAFMLDLPWAGDDTETVDNILIELIGAENIEEATGERELRKPKDIANRAVTVFDIKMRESDLEDARWGAYASLAVSVDGGPQEVINTGSSQVLITLWRCWCEGRFPVSGTFRLLGTPTKGRNQPVGFSVESAL